MEKGLTQSGGQLFCQRYWKKLLQLIVEGKLDPSWEFTHRFPLAKIDEAYKVHLPQPPAPALHSAQQRR